MPKTNLCKTEELPPSSTPAIEFAKLAIAHAVTKIAVGYAHYLKKNNGMEITFSKKVKDTYKPYGDLIISIYNLVKEFSMYDQLMPGIPYNSPSKWFEECILDLTKFELKSLLNNEGSCIGWGNLKKELKTYNTNWDYNFQKLSINNPFAKLKLTSLALLIEYSVIASQRNYKFEQEYWKPFVKAISSVSLYTKKRTDLEYFNVYSTGEIIQKNKRGKPQARYLPCLTEKLLMKLCT